MTTIGEYCQQNVVKPLDREKADRTRYWVPIFPVPKKGSDKLRLITDLRALNQCHQVPRHRGESWAQIQEVLRSPKNQFAVVLDLKSWFHHLQMAPEMRRWMRFKVGANAYELNAMPFGWNLSPWWSTKLAKPIRQWLNNHDIPHLWYVDDILILGANKVEAETRAALLIDKLTDLGIQVNRSKSSPQAATTATFLGHEINFADNRLSPPQEKVQTAARMCQHQLSGKNVQPKNLAALAGVLLDLAKSSAALHGLPKQLMKHAAYAVAENRKRFPDGHVTKLWGTTTRLTVGARECMRQAKEALKDPVPRVFRPAKEENLWVLQTDSSDWAWGATLRHNDSEVQATAARWGINDRKLHITHKEAKASALGVLTLLKWVPSGAHLRVETDAVSTAYAWIKGSKLKGMNQFITEALLEATKKSIFITSQHIQGETNVRADHLSRHPDPKSYKLDPKIFRSVCKRFGFWPDLDLFANGENHQVKRYCSWKPDRHSLGNAWDLNWSRFRPWINPPWDIIPQVLRKVHDDHATVLVCLPFWTAKHWWRDVRAMLISPPWVLAPKAMFQGPTGDWLPPPRWSTMFGILRG